MAVLSTERIQRQRRPRTMNQTQGLRGPSTLGVIAAIQHRLRERAGREVELGREIGCEGAELGPEPCALAARATHVFPDLLPPHARLRPHPPHSHGACNTITEGSSSSEKWESGHAGRESDEGRRKW